MSNPVAKRVGFALGGRRETDRAQHSRASLGESSPRRFAAFMSSPSPTAIRATAILPPGPEHRPWFSGAPRAVNMI